MEIFLGIIVMIFGVVALKYGIDDTNMIGVLGYVLIIIGIFGCIYPFAG